MDFVTALLVDRHKRGRLRHQGGYRLGNLVENKLEPIFNPAKNKYSWVDSGYLGISYQKEPSFIPSRIGNISDSYMSERVNKYLSDQKILKDKLYEKKKMVND